VVRMSSMRNTVNGKGAERVAQGAER